MTTKRWRKRCSSKVSFASSSGAARARWRTFQPPDSARADAEAARALHAAAGQAPRRQSLGWMRMRGAADQDAPLELTPTRRGFASHPRSRTCIPTGRRRGWKPAIAFTVGIASRWCPFLANQLAPPRAGLFHSEMPVRSAASTQRLTPRYRRLMDPELSLLHLLRKHWLALAVLLGVIWAIECRLEGNSAFETIAAPLLAATWLGVISLLDRWALRRVDRQND
jgi:hypothetical protein